MHGHIAVKESAKNVLLRASGQLVVSLHIYSVSLPIDKPYVICIFNRIVFLYEYLHPRKVAISIFPPLEGAAEHKNKRFARKEFGDDVST